MQRAVFVLFQLEEACRYIRDGRLERLRLALLLLDNAVELQLDDRVEEHLRSEQLRERLRDSILATDAPLDELPDQLREVVAWQPLAAVEKGKLQRFFDEKLRFLSERWMELDSGLTVPLSHLHRYRNEAYHRGRIRPETIRTAALILVEINCQLLSPMVTGLSYSSSEDYSWLKERFGVEPFHLIGDDGKLESMVEEIRRDIIPGDEAVAATLKCHLDSRLEDMESSLDFIVEAASGIDDRESALQASQEFKGTTLGRCQPILKKGNGGTRYAYSLASIASLKGRTTMIEMATGRLEAFRIFSKLETELEPIESCVTDLAIELDMAIQMEVDRRRGK